MKIENLTDMLCEQEGGVLTVTFDRPERRNAMTTVMLAELIYIIEQCQEDPTVRAVVIRGAGKGFCPGDELRGMGKLPEDFAFHPKSPVTHGALQVVLRTLPKPTIAVIHGFAFGVGMDLAMACDFRIAADDAQIRDQRVIERGMHAITGCAWFQPRVLGLTRAFQYLVLGEPFTGAEAVEAGMVTKSAPIEKLDETVAEMANKLAVGPTKAIGLMKRQIYEGMEMTHGEFMDFALPLISEIEIKDRLEGINAFVEKRPANFTGD